MTKHEFEQNIIASQNSLYRVARGYLRSEQDCLDAVSEAVLKAWQKLPSLRGEQYFNTWLTRILIRECINIQRKQKRVTPVETIPERTQPPGGSAELAQVLDTLPAKLRTPTVLHYMEGYDVADIAHILHTTKGTVCSRLHRARAALRAVLKEEDL